jgi:hypothetical protein
VAAVRFAEDDVAGADFLPLLALALVPAGAGNDNQGLAERMRVPGAPGAGLEADQGPREPGRLLPRELPLDGEVVS